MLYKQVICLITFFSCAVFVEAKERKFDELKNSELLELLASQNPSPKMLDEERYKIAQYPKGYDQGKQVTVFAAASELRKRGVSAFPDLIRAADDRRYSCLQLRDTEESRELLSVGALAWWIIESQVHAWEYTLNIPHGMPPLRWTVPDRKNDLQKWFEIRKDWTLNQFQKETVQINQKEISVSTVYSDSEKKNLLQQLDKLNQQLSQKGRFFEVSGGEKRKGHEILFHDVSLVAKLKSKE